MQEALEPQVARTNDEAPGRSSASSTLRTGPENRSSHAVHHLRSCCPPGDERRAMQNIKVLSILSGSVCLTLAIRN
ncbi:hypothetical protein HBB16_19625 [Pseudonocardia sp. MCCB 268]|nr:hypothetical protein [Pseudonocardia cytotoxica]